MAVTLSLMPSCDKRRIRSYAGSPSRVGDRDLDIDLAAPGGDLAGLAFHLRELIRKDLEGERAIGMACTMSRAKAL